MINNIRLRLVAAGAASALLWGAIAMAQESSQSADSLAEALAARADTPHADTALVVTNLGNAATRVGMRAWTHRGAPLGFKEIEVPANGLTYVFVSEFAEAAGVESFIGKVEARGIGNLTGSSVVVGPGVTDIQTLAKVSRVPLTATRPSPSTVPTQVTQLTFPVVVTY